MALPCPPRRSSCLSQPLRNSQLCEEIRVIHSLSLKDSGHFVSILNFLSLKEDDYFVSINYLVQHTAHGWVGSRTSTNVFIYSEISTETYYTETLVRET